jgi:hypothetical protein
VPIKLYNKSPVPNAILRPLITAAGQRIGVRLGVVVKVLGPLRFGCRGTAYRGSPLLWHLTRKRKGVQRKRMIDSDGGYLELHVPRAHLADDHLAAAERFYRLCLHEWGHIRDYQQERPWNRLAWSYSEQHDNRPQERRANGYMRDALRKPLSHKAEEAILALAIWLEGQAR